MLILTRKPGEALMINDDIRLSILSVRGNQVRIGITAPQDVEVHREEIFERIHGGVEDDSQAEQEPHRK